jgi:two-component system NtrC family sensor kinase
MSLRFKTIIGIALIESILLALLIFTVMGHMHDNAEEELLKRSSTAVNLFASMAKDPVLSYDLASLDTFSQELASNPDIAYVRVRDSNDSILSTSEPEGQGNRLFIGDSGLGSVDDGVFDTSATISEGGVEFGRVEIGINTASINLRIIQTRKRITCIAAAEMTLVALFSLLLGNYLTKNLSDLRTAAKSISNGDYTQELVVKSKDEIGEAVLAFNHMSTALREVQDSRNTFEFELVELNRTLEDHVERRTDKINSQLLELQTANQMIADTQLKLLQSEKLASLGQLSAGVAHEINNPIAYVHSNLISLSEYVGVYQKLLLRFQNSRNVSNSEFSELMGEIQRIEEEEDIEFIGNDINSLIGDTLDGAHRVKEIVKGLQEFSYNNGDTKSPCDLISSLESTLKIVNNDLKNRCTVITAFETTLMVHANKGQINQVLLNLLVNAGHAVSSGGTITIATSSSEGMIQVSVKDDGSGIDQENLDRIFDPFFTTKDVGVGTGLGLSISYGIIKDHGGTISVESEVGQGSTFIITLPAIEQPTQELAA